MTLLTLGGDDKIACLTTEWPITGAEGGQRRHGPLSWALAQALLNTAPHALWGEIVYEMVRLLHTQNVPLPFAFHGQPTHAFGIKATTTSEAGKESRCHTLRP